MTNLIERLRDDEANSFGGLYCAKRELVHEAATALSEAKAENERLTRERDEAVRVATNVSRALTSLTPGGSEYHSHSRILDAYFADTEACVAVVRERYASGHKAKLELVGARAALNPKGGDMGKPEDIPQDVFEAAFSVVSEIQMQDAGSVESWDARASVARVARAILAERERCAAIADEHERAKWGGPDRDPTVAMRKAALSIAAAIRKGSD